MKDYSKTIETERLILRKFKLDDAQQLFDNYGSHEVVTKFLTWKPHASIEATIDYLSNINGNILDEGIIPGNNTTFYYHLKFSQFYRLAICTHY